MQLDIKKEIITSYEKLIHDCEIALENGIDADKNLGLINEYKKVMNHVKAKPNNSYDSIIEEMKRMENNKREAKLSSLQKV